MIEIEAFDEATRQDVLGRTGPMGRLGELAGWLAAAQATVTPHVPHQPRLIVIAGEHAISALGVSTHPPGWSGRMAGELTRGTAAVARLAAAFAVPLTVRDIGPASGRIDREDALTDAETQQAFDTGRALVDEAVDAGTDLLALTALASGGSTVAGVLVAAMTGSEPIAVVQRGGLDDEAWMRKTAAVRDALRRVHARVAQWDPMRLLAITGGADCAALTGALVQAAVRRTPVLVDGLLATATTLVAQQLAYDATPWWQVADVTTHPAHPLALARVQLAPVQNLGLAESYGEGALTALGLLRAATLIAAER